MTKVVVLRWRKVSAPTDSCAAGSPTCRGSGKPFDRRSSAWFDFVASTVGRRHRHPTACGTSGMHRANRPAVLARCLDDPTVRSLKIARRRKAPAPEPVLRSAWTWLYPFSFWCKQDWTCKVPKKRRRTTGTTTASCAWRSGLKLRGRSSPASKSLTRTARPIRRALPIRPVPEPAANPQIGINPTGVFP